MWMPSSCWLWVLTWIWCQVSNASAFILNYSLRLSNQEQSSSTIQMDKLAITIEFCLCLHLRPVYRIFNVNFDCVCVIRVLTEFYLSIWFFLYNALSCYCFQNGIIAANCRRDVIRCVPESISTLDTEKCECDWGCVWSLLLVNTILKRNEHEAQTVHVREKQDIQVELWQSTHLSSNAPLIWIVSIDRLRSNIVVRRKSPMNIEHMIRWEWKLNEWNIGNFSVFYFRSHRIT